MGLWDSIKKGIGFGAAAGTPFGVAGNTWGASLGGLAGAAGMLDESGTDSGNRFLGNAGYQGLQNEAAAAQDPKLQQALADYGSGKISLDQAMAASPLAASFLATDPRTGTRMASQQVQENPLFSEMFGQGGLQERMGAEEKDLASRGFSLQPEDHEAYGQASGQIARMFGQEEDSLAQALAARGLSAAPSGAAVQSYSGLMGNKHERLAQAQRQIADDRMKMNQQRLQAVRNSLMDSNRLGQAALQDQWARNRGGVNDRRDTYKDAMSAEGMAQGQSNTQWSQREESRLPSLGELAVGWGNTAVGAGVGAATGGAGRGLGNGGLGATATKKG